MLNIQRLSGQTMGFKPTWVKAEQVFIPSRTVHFRSGHKFIAAVIGAVALIGGALACYVFVSGNEAARINVRNIRP